MEKKVIVAYYENGVAYDEKGRKLPPAQEGDAAIEDGWTKKIKELETENRMLTAALKSRKAPPMRAEMDLGPVFDAKTELMRLVEILGAAIYLIHPGEDDTEKGYVITALLAVQEQLADLAEGIAGALEGMEIIAPPAAVATNAGA